MALTGRTALLAALGAAVVGLIAPSLGALLALNAVLLVLVLVDLALAADVRRLQLSRAGTTAVRLGETAVVTLTVANPGPRRLRATLRDAWEPSAGAQQERVSLDLAPHAQQRLRTVLLPTRRGDRVAARVTVRAVGPLGLAARQAGHAAPWRVRVLAPFTSRRHLPARLARLRELDGRAAVRTRGAGTEFDSLRDYVIGDDVRAIDWRASARRTAVVVRTWRPERDRRVLVVLDTGRASAGRVGDAPRLDAALDATLLLAALAGRAGDRVDLLAYDRRVRTRVRGKVGAQLLPALVEATAMLQPALLETDHAGLVRAVRAMGRHDLVVLLTGLDKVTVTEGLLPVLAPLTARSRVLLATVADPRVTAMAALRADAEQVYAAAAASREQLERRWTTALLRRAGVSVLEAEPERIAPELADAYLELKAAGRL